MRKLALSGLTMLAVLLPATAAHAHFLGRDAVDSGEIRWGDETSYDDARQHANSVWDALGHINIVADDWKHYEDLTWMDTTRPDSMYDGWYTNSIGADEIYFNKHWVAGYSTFNRRALAAHELGHALGLDHSYSDQLMNSCSTCSGHNTPQSHDISDYNALWGGGSSNDSDTIDSNYEQRLGPTLDNTIGTNDTISVSGDVDPNPPGAEFTDTKKQSGYS